MSSQTFLPRKNRLYTSKPRICLTLRGVFGNTWKHGKNNFKVEVSNTSSHKIIPICPASSGDLGWLWWFVSRDYSYSGMVSRCRLTSTSRWLPGGRWFSPSCKKYCGNGVVWRGVRFFVWRVSSFEVQVVVGELFLEGVYKYTGACIISRTSLEDLNMKIETHVVQNYETECKLDPTDGTWHRQIGARTICRNAMWQWWFGWMKVRLILKAASSSLTVKRRPLGDPTGKFEKWYTPWSSTWNLKMAPLERDILFFWGYQFQVLC